MFEKCSLAANDLLIGGVPPLPAYEHVCAHFVPYTFELLGLKENGPIFSEALPVAHANIHVVNRVNKKVMQSAAN